MKSNVKERLICFIRSKNISKNKFEIDCGLSKRYVSNIRVSIQPNVIEKISLIFPELNVGWLLTGEGEMLKTEIVKTPDVKLVDTNFLLDRIEKLAIRNNELEKEVEQLKKALKQSVKIKPYLKSGDESMLVAEKSK